MKKTRKIFVIIILLLSLVLMPSCDTSVTYDLDNGYFTVDGYNRSETKSVSAFGNSSVTYYIKIKAECSSAITAYSVSAQFFSSDGALLETYESGTVKQTVEADTLFTVSAEVSQNTYTEIDSLTAVFKGKSYENSSGGASASSGKEYTVTLVYNNGDADGTVTVKEGATLKTPSDPVKSNYIFTGWYTTSSLSVKYDFSQSVNKDFTIYAGYEIDATALTNTITATKIKGLVTVYNKCYNTFLGITTSYETHQGSGFCFYISSGCYYILTNCHVAAQYSDYSHQKFTIEDYKGNEYTGYLYKNPGKTVSAIAASYDLACLYFKADSADVTKFTIGEDPEISDDVISLGTPGGQTNYINYGTAKSYTTITLTTSKEYSNVTFSVIRHTATISSGCSGGPLLDSDLNVVGVNYAGSSSDSGYNYAIPASKINEFLKSYVYS